MTNLQKYDYITLVIIRLPSLMNTYLKELIACQFALESNFGNSNLAQLKNNHSGMKLAKLRLSTRNPESIDDVFARYDSMKDCIVDYVLWLQYQGFRQDSTVESWKALMKIYCPEPDYLTRIDRILDNYKIWQVEYEKIY